MALNLVQHRGEPNVWDHTRDWLNWDLERMLLAAGAGVLLVAGFRRRSGGGLLLTLGGASLAWWAGRGIEERRAGRGRLRDACTAWPWGRGRKDVVTEAAEESFPASDPPSWTPTTGNVNTR